MGVHHSRSHYSDRSLLAGKELLQEEGPRNPNCLGCDSLEAHHIQMNQMEQMEELHNQGLNRLRVE